MTADPPGESEIDRAVRSLGRTIEYPDGSICDRRTGARLGRVVVVQPVGFRLRLHEQGIDPPTDSEIRDWKNECAEITYRRERAEKRLRRGG